MGLLKETGRNFRLKPLFWLCYLAFAIMTIIGFAGCTVAGVVPPVPVGGIGAGTGQDGSSEESDKYKYLEQSNTQIHQAGTIESIIEYAEDFVMGVHYPVFGKDEIDGATKEFVGQQGPGDAIPGVPADDVTYPRREIPPDSTCVFGSGNRGGSRNGGITGRKIDPSKPMVALTFDDGPVAGTTCSVLDTLNKHGAVATFFILGNRVQDNADLLKRMVSEGHEIGNHSFSHKRLTSLSPEELQYQIEKTQMVIKQVTGVEPVMMRPTFGSYNSQLQQSVGMPMIMWSVDTRDWETRDVESIVRNVLDNVRDGDIILMHDIYKTTAEAVKILVPELLDRGFQLVTVSELLSARGIPVEAGKIYRRAGGL